MSFPKNQNNDPVVIDVVADNLVNAASVATGEVDAARRAGAQTLNITLHVGDNATTVQLAVREDGKLEMQLDPAMNVGAANFAATQLRKALEALYGEENVVDTSRAAAESAIKAGADFNTAKHAASARKLGFFATTGGKAPVAPQADADKAKDSRPEPGHKPTDGVFNKGPK